MLKFLRHPKNWPIFIGYLFLRLLILIPFSWQMTLGKYLGIIGYYFAKTRRNVVETNIKLCFPYLSASEQKALVKINFIFTTQSLFETLMGYWASDKRLQPLIEFHGSENLDKALTHDKGALILTPHFTAVDFILRPLNMCLKKPAYVMNRENSNPFIEYIIHQGRINHCEKTIGKKDMKSLYKSLLQNCAVFYAPDQNFSYNHVFVPFFGIPAATVTATSRIAQGTGAKIVPFVYYRKKHSYKYVLKLLPALENFPSGDDTKDTARIMKIIEDHVREHPEQYLWSHRRFKTRPEGEPEIYPKRKKKRRRDGTRRRP